MEAAWKKCREKRARGAAFNAETLASFAKTRYTNRTDTNMSLGRGVKVRQNGEKVDIDLFIIVEYGISISAVAASIIETVKYKVEHLTGISVGRVNVCVEDIRV